MANLDDVNAQAPVPELITEVEVEEIMFETEEFDSSTVSDRKIPEILLLATGLLVIIAIIVLMFKWCAARRSKAPETEADPEKGETQEIENNEKAPLNE